MKAISVRSPWAAWIFTPHPMMGLKDVENRTWQTKYRGPLAIHAGQRLAEGFTESDVESYRASERQDHTAWTRGAIIGVVDLIDIAPSSSAWAMSEHCHWRLASPRLLPAPIVLPGRLQLFDVDLNL